MEDTILTILGSAGATGGICFLIFKVWFEHQFARRLAEFQDKLKRETEVSIAQSSFRYSQVFRNTEKVISTVYQNLIKFKLSVDQYPFSSFRDAVKNQTYQDKIRKEYMEFFNHFVYNKIYIPPTTASKISKFAEAVSDAQITYESMIRMDQGKVSGELVFEKYKEYETKHHALPEILRDLEKDFQHLLGIKDSEELKK